MSESTEARFAEFEALGQQWAEAKAQYEYMDEFRKSKIAILMKSSGESTAAAQEREALASKDYRDFLDGLRVANERMLGLQMKIKAIETRFEHWRTVQATRRAEMNLR
jgi:hypothetical protein